MVQIEVKNKNGWPLTPCSLEVARREVALGRARWVGPRAIRLRFNPFHDRKVRKKILERDDFTCAYCRGKAGTIDHLLPWSQGGRTTMQNCVAACAECNGRRGNLPVEAFIETLEHPVTHPLLVTRTGARTG